MISNGRDQSATVSVSQGAEVWAVGAFPGLVLLAVVVSQARVA